MRQKSELFHEVFLPIAKFRKLKVLSKPLPPSMGNLSQIQIAILVIAAVSLIGVIVSVIRKSSVFAGYADYQQDILKIARSLKAELFRDGEDLVVSGNHNKLPLRSEERRVGKECRSRW